MAREGWKCLERASSLPTGKEIKGGSNWPARNFWSYPEKLAASGLDAELRPESSAIIGAGRGGAGPGRGGGAWAGRPSPLSFLRRPAAQAGVPGPRLVGGAGGRQGVVGERWAGFGFQTPSLCVEPSGCSLDWDCARVPAAAPSYKKQSHREPLKSWILN